MCNGDSNIHDLYIITACDAKIYIKYNNGHTERLYFANNVPHNQSLD